jgi:hypothetical protein
MGSDALLLFRPDAHTLLANGQHSELPEASASFYLTLRVVSFAGKPRSNTGRANSVVPSKTLWDLSNPQRRKPPTLASFRSLFI